MTVASPKLREALAELQTTDASPLPPASPKKAAA
jgi:hypothetical protein